VQQRRRPSSFSFFAALQLNCSIAKKKAFFFFFAAEEEGIVIVMGVTPNVLHSE